MNKKLVDEQNEIEVAAYLPITKVSARFSAIKFDLDFCFLSA